jgi:hypothetical protein
MLGELRRENRGISCLDLREMIFDHSVGWNSFGAQRTGTLHPPKSNPPGLTLLSMVATFQIIAPISGLGFPSNLAIFESELKHFWRLTKAMKNRFDD